MTTSCGAAKYSSETGAKSSSTCTDCPANTNTSKGLGTALIACVANAGYTGEDGKVADPCPKDTFKADTGSAKCTKCVANAATDNTACVANAGYSGAAGEAPTVCPVGTFKAAIGPGDCKKCPDHSKTGDKTGSTAIAACVADAGFTGSGDDVVECEANTYKATAGAEDCTPCAANSKTGDKTGSTASADCVEASASDSVSGSVSGSGSDSNDSGSNAWWIILVVLMVLGGVAAAAFFLQKKKDRVAPVQDREALKKAFDSFDIDHSGELSKDEFRAVMTMRSGLTDAEFEKLFSKVDVDQSGRISFDEYYAWSQE